MTWIHDTIDEEQKLQQERREARRRHFATMEAKIAEAEKKLEAAIIEAGHEAKRHESTVLDYETKEYITQVGDLAYVDGVYFGHDWGFYEQGFK